MRLKEEIAFLDFLLHINELLRRIIELPDISKDQYFIIGKLLKSFFISIHPLIRVAVKSLKYLDGLEDKVALFMLSEVMFAIFAVAFCVDHGTSLNALTDITCTYFVAD